MLRATTAAAILRTFAFALIPAMASPALARAPIPVVRLSRPASVAKRLPGLSLEAERNGAAVPVLAQTPTENGRYTAQVRGAFKGKYRVLLWEDRVVAAGDRSGRTIPFDLAVPIGATAGESTRKVELNFRVVLPRGEVLEERVTLEIQPPPPLAAPAKPPEPTVSPLADVVTLSIGATAFSLREDGVADFGMTALTVKGAYSHRFGAYGWVASANAFVNALPLIGDSSGITARVYGLNARLGYEFAAPGAAWRPALSGGLYYTGMSVTNAALGYSALAYPQLYPSLEHRLSATQSLTGYLKYVPLTPAFFGLSFDDRELAGGLAWSFAATAHQPGRWSIGLDISDLRLHFTPAHALRTFATTLGAGYSF